MFSAYWYWGLNRLPVPYLHQQIPVFRIAFSINSYRLQFSTRRWQQAALNTLSSFLQSLPEGKKMPVSTPPAYKYCYRPPQNKCANNLPLLSGKQKYSEYGRALFHYARSLSEPGPVHPGSLHIQQNQGYKDKFCHFER
ncbi:hypothetical protein SDC9_70271 [bioreactor metagenome]|uniref:Uncharacterized protein n=1 Tax=bioreactor metagenome TaxID=1076179 RepID=A0A644Y6K1_9ZZZZ